LHAIRGSAPWSGVRSPAVCSQARSPATTLPAGSRLATVGGYGPAFPEEQLYRIVSELEAIAGECGRSVSQVALNWLLDRPTVSTVVVGARNEAQLRDNLAAAEFRLSAQQMERLDAVSARPPIYPCWHQLEEFAEPNPFPVPIAKY